MILKLAGTFDWNIWLTRLQLFLEFWTPGFQMLAYTTVILMSVVFLSSFVYMPLFCLKLDDVHFFLNSLYVIIQ